jgi:hypothetical protein
MNQQSLKEKSAVLSRIIMLTRDIYQSGQLSEAQKGLMETLIGAGIWYLPTSTELFSGYISKRALESLQSDPIHTKLVEEHAFPRKVAGQLLYSIQDDELLTPDGSGLEKLYRERFGKFNLVLKSENNKLKKFQKKGVFLDETTAYALAEVELVPFTVEEFQRYKRMKQKYPSGKETTQPTQLEK